MLDVEACCQQRNMHDSKHCVGTITIDATRDCRSCAWRLQAGKDPHGCRLHPLGGLPTAPFQPCPAGHCPSHPFPGQSVPASRLTTMFSTACACAPVSRGYWVGQPSPIDLLLSSAPPITCLPHCDAATDHAEAGLS